ncbi:MAG: chorismate mutase [Planctomycetota bacterium]
MSDQQETAAQYDSREADDRPIPSLDELRVRIDAVDRQLVELLNQRAQLVVDVGRYKRKHGTPIYAPDREAAVLSKVLGESPGPLPARTLEAIWKEMMSGSFALEQPLRIGYLGPKGSFSHAAAVKHFGQSVSFENLHEIAVSLPRFKQDDASTGWFRSRTRSAAGLLNRSMRSVTLPIAMCGSTLRCSWLCIIVCWRTVSLRRSGVSTRSRRHFRNAESS